MIASGKKAEKITTPALLSTLWIVVMINMLKADILSLYIPGALDELANFVGDTPVSYTHLRAHETVLDLVCRLLLEKKKDRRNCL